MWLACTKYHPTYGIPGTEVRGDTLSEQMAYMHRGWEWWPSLLWQVIWTWIVRYPSFKSINSKRNLAYMTHTLQGRPDSYFPGMENPRHYGMACSDNCLLSR